MKVLITGGTGSLGRALVRRLLRDGAERIVVYSRSESRQAEFAAELGEHEALRWFIGDVRDRRRLGDAMWHCNAVIHTAALKRVDAMAYNPDEVRKTNIQGSANVIDAALWAGVQRLVMVSSDKAVAPTNVYGVSKAQMEAEAVASNSKTFPRGLRVACTRYGNVIGSTGSVVGLWRQAIARGEPLTITDPDMTRFWLTLDQAVEVILTALQRMEGGEIFVPLLPAMRLGDLADVLAGPEYPRKVVGLRHGGEKRHEILWTPEESERITPITDGLVAIAPSFMSWRPDEPWPQRLGIGGTEYSSETAPHLYGEEMRRLLCAL